MRTRILPWLVLAALVFVSRPARAEPPARPTVLLRLRSLDDLFQDARYVLRLQGHDDDVKRLDELLKSTNGESGLDGIATKKPLGLYGDLDPILVKSKLYFLVPVADEKALRARLRSLAVDHKVEEGKDGVSSMKLGRLEVPVYFRFANGYLYAGLHSDSLRDRDRLPAPATVLPAGEIGTADAVLNIDRIPRQWKELALNRMALALAEVKGKDVPRETAAQRKFRHAVLDEVSLAFKSLLDNGGELRARLDLDRKAHEVVVSMDLTPLPDSSLARDVAHLAEPKSVGASFSSGESALCFFTNLTLAEDLRKHLGPVVDEYIASALARQKAGPLRQVDETLLKALAPTFKGGILDGGFDVRARGKGTYQVVGGVRVRDGAGVARALRKALESLPASDRQGGVQLDAAKAGGVSIHRLSTRRLDAQTRRLLGDTFYLAARDDALLFAGGDKGLDAIKQAVAAVPKAGPVGRLDLSLSQLVPLLGGDPAATAEAARTAFKDKGSDKVRFTLTGGKTLSGRMTMKTAVLRFYGLIDRAGAGKE